MDNDQMISLLTLVRKEVSRFFKLWSQTIIPPVITTSLYFIIFGAFISKQMQKIEGFEFIDFITPGLIMMSVISNSYINVCSSFFIAKFQRSIEEIFVSSTKARTIIIGYISGGIIRALIVSLLLLIIAFYFTSMTVKYPFMFIGIIFLTAVLFSLAGLTNAICANKFDDINIVPTFILTPLSYLGGIFYSVEQLSESWKIILKLNPLFYLINGLRYSCLGFADVNWIYTYIILFSLITILYLLNNYLLKHGIFLKN